jgi:4-hydroxy-tetrahydrodipicolinate synthase
MAVETVNGRMPVICGIYVENYCRRAYTRDAQSEGANRLLIFPPNTLLFGGKPDMVVQHFAGFASAVSLPLVVFMYPAHTRTQYDLETLLRAVARTPLDEAEPTSLRQALYDAGLMERQAAASLR